MPVNSYRNCSRVNYPSCPVHLQSSWSYVCYRTYSCMCCAAMLRRVSAAGCKVTSEALWVSLPETRLSQTTTCLLHLQPTSVSVLPCSAHIKTALHLECTWSPGALRFSCCGSPKRHFSNSNKNQSMHIGVQKFTLHLIWLHSVSQHSEKSVGSSVWPSNSDS